MVSIGDGQVSAALTAVAAIDDTPADMLASMIVEEWLRRHSHRFMVAAEALARLGDVRYPAGEDSDDGEPSAVHDGIDDREVDDAARPVTPANAGEGDEPPSSPSPATHRCTVDGCNFIGRSPQSLGGHTSTAHRNGTKPQPKAPVDNGTPTVLCEDCGRTFKSKHGLAVHRTRAHPDADGPHSREGIPEAEKPNAPITSCRRCHKQVGRDNLRRHPAHGYVCPICWLKLENAGAAA